MIKFDFSMSNEDGNNLMDIIQQSIADALEGAMEALADGNRAEADWFKGHAAYLRTLKQIVSDGARKVS